MRKIYILLAIACAACNPGKQHSENKDSTSVQKADPKTSETGKFWTSYTVPEGYTSMKQLRKYAGETAAELSGNLNLNYPGIRMTDLVYMKPKDSGIFVMIPDAQKLVSGMGSAGAADYMATAVYTLTELPGVKYVHFDFIEGDHARPGRYSRQDFVKF